MKKIYSLIMAFLLVGVLLTGCSSNKEVKIDVTKMADALKTSVPFKDTLSEPNDAAFGRVYSIDSADIVSKKVYVSTGATAEEIAVFEAKDKDAAVRIKKAVDTRISENLTNFEDYNPEEQKKLSDPVIVTTGNYVVLCVSDDNAAAKKCIEENSK